jgi:hypothetical protein
VRNVDHIPSPRDSISVRRQFLRAASQIVLAIGLVTGASLWAAEKNPNQLKQIEQNVREAETVLDSVDRGLRANQFDDVQTGLKQYKGLLESTESNASEYQQEHRKTPHQFKDAEIRLRKQLRKLQDLRPELPIPLRETLDAAIESANKLRKRFMGDLFDKPPRQQTKNDFMNDL